MPAYPIIPKIAAPLRSAKRRSISSDIASRKSMTHLSDVADARCGKLQANGRTLGEREKNTRENGRRPKLGRGVVTAKRWGAVKATQGKCGLCKWKIGSTRPAVRRLRRQRSRGVWRARDLCYVQTYQEFLEHRGRLRRFYRCRAGDPPSFQQIGSAFSP
jgi:hypothetical protein